jgi:hypothetical protein
LPIGILFVSVKVFSGSRFLLSQQRPIHIRWGLGLLDNDRSALSRSLSRASSAFSKMGRLGSFISGLPFGARRGWREGIDFKVWLATQIKSFSPLLGTTATWQGRQLRFYGRHLRLEASLVPRRSANE